MTEPTISPANWQAGIEHSEVEGAVCVRFRQRKIVDMTQIEAMSDELSRLSATDGARMVLNLDGVEFLSSAALNKLVSLERKIRGRAGKLAICSLTNTVRDVLSITCLDKMFSIHNSEEAAIAAIA